MSDLAYTAILIGGFAAVALVVRAAGWALNAAERKDHDVPERMEKDRARRGAVREPRG